ncbi:MAG: glycosyltransferase family 2 protein [Candidatus Pacebacteria bacterium]|nr:glycosyltransferase family 2 protein [Candidatus Paceibacterota bacterium]
MQWDSDKLAFAEQVKQTASRLKIVLKTKDEHLFLPMWIAHHERIVGRNNIIIFDNNSSRSDVIDYYNRNNDLIISSYTGFHNYIHVQEMFKELYEAINSSCDYFIFLDSDEFLVWSDGVDYISDGRLIEKLANLGDARAIPTMWLHNVISNSQLFVCGTTPGHLRGGLQWGKPIIKSNTVSDKIILHNAQLDSSYYDIPLAINFFCLHMTKLFPEQRIASNIRKLVARKFADRDETVSQILAKDASRSTDPNIPLYLNEIKLLLSSVPVTSQNSALVPECMRFNEDGSIAFYSDLERETFINFINNENTIRSLFTKTL